VLSQFSKEVNDKLISMMNYNSDSEQSHEKNDAPPRISRFLNNKKKPSLKKLSPKEI